MVEKNRFGSYGQVLDYLYSHLPVYQRTGKASYKIDLATTRAIDDYFHHPHKKFPAIHVAGTNGKGSVSHMLASVFMERGMKTGLYSSPHLKDFRERIRINGKPVPEKFILDFVNDNLSFFNTVKPSFFEMTVAMAFQYFAGEKVDVAIVETGLGGRLDSTNIITPVCSVITNIGMDHTQYLGNSLPEIAREKAGIIKTRIPVVIGKTQPESEPVFREVASARHSPLFFADQHYDIPLAMATPAGNRIFTVNKNNEPFLSNLETDLAGDYQQENIITLLQVLDTLQNEYPIKEEALRKGLKNVIRNSGLRGRWEVINQHPLMVCDTGHNAEAFKWIIPQIKNTPYKNLHMVIGFVNDKQPRKILEMMPKEARYYFTQADIPRALPAKKLAEEAAKAGLSGIIAEPVKKAVTLARNNAGPFDLIFIGGSTFVVAEAL